MCRDCFQAGHQCPGSDHTLQVRNMAIDCRQTNSRTKDCVLQSKTRSSPFSCSACATEIPQGRVYRKSSAELLSPSKILKTEADCCNCTFKYKEDNFYLCHPCYKSGSRCSVPSSHTLQMHLAGIECTKPRSPKSNCSRCEKAVGKGSYFYRKYCTFVLLRWILLLISEKTVRRVKEATLKSVRPVTLVARDAMILNMR